MTQELKPGEFVVNADGSVTGRNPLGDFHGGVAFAHTPERVAYFDRHVGGSYFDWLTKEGFTRVYPESIQFPSGRTYSTEGSAIKEVAPAEVKRAPLAYFTERTEFDPFKGFVSFNLSPADGMPWKREDCALTRMSEGTNPTHGSAFLLKD